MVIVKARQAPAIRGAVAAVDSSVPIYDVRTLDERVGAALGRPRFNAALALAAIGVYGVLSYSVRLRMREIGVRLAVGADARRVTTLIVGDGLRLACSGAAIGLAAAIALTRLLQGLLAGVTPADPRVLAAAAGVMVAAAAAARGCRRAAQAPSIRS